MKQEELIAVYRKTLTSADLPADGEFPPAPLGVLSPTEFVDALLRTAAEYDPRARHSFMRNLVAGRYGRPQLREWARQYYGSVLAEIRRHARMAGAARECDLLRSLLSYVAIEADADPVGGSFFSLPQLWVKFGITLGLTREEIVSARPCAELQGWEENVASAASADEVPVSIFVNAVLDSALAQFIGEQLQKQLGCPRDSLDYFWAIAGNRWGEDAGRPILEACCDGGEHQQALWRNYTLERESARIAERLSIIQAAVDGAS